jgi:tetratricopeptide (TPR) repeat protein
MNKEFLIDAAKRNWYLFAVLLALPVVALVVSGAAEDGDEDAVKSRFATLPADAATMNGAARSTSPGLGITPGPFKPATSRANEAQNAINKYIALNEANPASPDVPLNMKRMGHLYYAVLHDYEKAITQYELLMLKFPEFEGLEEIYPSLAVCYERTGNVTMEYETYRRMVEEFPAESEYHQFAQLRLNGQR